MIRKSVFVRELGSRELSFVRRLLVVGFSRGFCSGLFLSLQRSPLVVTNLLSLRGSDRGEFCVTNTLIASREDTLIVFDRLLSENFAKT